MKFEREAPEDFRKMVEALGIPSRLCESGRLLQGAFTASDGVVTAA
jgi:hypothetical protein